MKGEIEMRQQTVNVKGLEHPAAVPVACRIGPILATSAVLGKDPASGELPEGAEDQARNAFINLRRVLEAAGMDLGDVVKLTIFVLDNKYRDIVYKYWNETYPNPERRPARHTLLQPVGIGLLQLEALAVAKDA